MTGWTRSQFRKLVGDETSKGSSPLLSSTKGNKMFSFTVSDKESKIANDWLMEHKKVCKVTDVGAIGGKYTWSFTQTGLGCITVLKCACGEEITVTDFENW